MTVIFFDLWDTLGTKNISFSKALRRHFGISDEAFYDRYESSMQLRRWESLEEMAASFLHSFGIEATRRNVHYVVRAQEDVLTFATPIPGVRRSLEKLHGRYRLGVLSNTTCFEASVLRKWGFEQYFEHLVFSWETGFLKPSRESFLAACKRFGVEPEECVFIDDSKKNCRAAEKLGMRTHQFMDEPGFESFVRDLLR